MVSKKKVAILYGGRSVEHGVSINSARNIFEFIDKDQFEPLPIGISKNGQWFLTKTVDKDIEQEKH
jgi:D-alanine-D-alanine ligase